MSGGGGQFMHILLFFDLPVTSLANKKEYRYFRSFLQKNGYTMIQFSIYSRLCKGLDDASKHMKRIGKNLPSSGSIRSICITNKQYGRMIHWVGEPKANEKIQDKDQLILI